MLQRSNISVSELEAQKEETHDPQVLVPSVDFILGVGLAHWFILSTQALHVVSLLDGVEQKKHVILSLEDGAEGIQVVDFFWRHLQVDGLTVFGCIVCFRLGAVSAEVVCGAHHNHTTDQEEERGHHEQDLEILVVSVATGERILALAVDKVDEGPAVDCEAHEGDKLGKGQPSRVHRVAEVPVLKEF